jgi:hypothetical protein
MAQYLHDQRYVQSASMTRAFSRILSIVGPSDILSFRWESLTAFQ